ncbi:MAG: peptidylprolyl isomerase [Deltaproteobacteria bacterium]|nr:peptidylprolyl isomerase [Deltaproteobacteria bacterium]MCW5802376.1 peptidylprolyl isomerase [Deltaproteobacteria bacterium]
MRTLPFQIALLVVVPLVTGARADDKVPPAPAAAPAATKAARTTVDRVVAVVNDAVILQSELEQRIAPVRAAAMEMQDLAERSRRLAKLQGQLLEEMVNDELMLQAAVAAKITVEQSELQATIDYIKERNQLDDAQLADAMKAQGLSFDHFRRDLMRQRAINQLVMPRMQLGEDDIKRRYDELSRRAANASRVQLSQIVFELPEHPTEQQLAAAKARAQAALDRIKGGEKFADVATAVTDDARTRPTGGQLGWFDPDTIDPAWEPVVFGMSKGDVRGPIQGKGSLILFHADEVQVTAMKPYDQMKGELTKQLKEKELAKLTTTWIAELRKKAHVELKI